jgi:hypothetical protein
MALTSEQKKFEAERAACAVKILYDAGAGRTWTAEELGRQITSTLGTDGSKAPVGDNAALAGWIIEGLVKSKAMIQAEGQSGELTKEAVFQYHNKSNFFSIKTPVGLIKVRQGAVVTIV